MVCLSGNSVIFVKLGSSSMDQYVTLTAVTPDSILYDWICCINTLEYLSKQIFIGWQFSITWDLKTSACRFEVTKQKCLNKLKSLKVAKWKKDEWRMMNVEGWWFQAVEGFCDGQTNKQTDICECRVAFATENIGLTYLVK